MAHVRLPYTMRMNTRERVRTPELSASDEWASHRRLRRKTNVAANSAASDALLALQLAAGASSAGSRISAVPSSDSNIRRVADSSAAADPLFTLSDAVVQERLEELLQSPTVEESRPARVRFFPSQPRQQSWNRNWRRVHDAAANSRAADALLALQRARVEISDEHIGNLQW